MARDLTKNRICCDGRCVQGRQCPAFAPGTIDMPHRALRSMQRHRQALRVLAWLGALALLMLVVWAKVTLGAAS